MKNGKKSVWCGEGFMSCVSPDLMRWVWYEAVRAGFPVWMVVVVSTGWFISALGPKVVSIRNKVFSFTAPWAQLTHVPVKYLYAITHRSHLKLYAVLQI